MAETWDESKPAGSRRPSLGDDDIREFKRAVRERLAEDHDFESTESPAFGGTSSTIGKHKFMTLVQRNTSKVTASDEVAFQCKSVSGNPEVVLTPPSAGTDRQITKNSGANINLTTGDFENYLIKSGFYDTGSINASTTYSDIANFGVRSAQLDTGAVTAAKIPAYGLGAAQLDTASVTAVKLASEETAGNNEYETSAGSTTSGSWVERSIFKFITSGSFRLYWGYGCVNNDWNTIYARLVHNGQVLEGPFSRKSTTYLYRTYDITVASGDEVYCQIYTTDNDTTAGCSISLRGTNRLALYRTISAIT